MKYCDKMDSDTTVLFRSEFGSTYSESSIITSMTSGESAISLQNLPVGILNRRMATQSLRETRSFNNLIRKLRKFMSYDAAAARRRRLRNKRARNKRRGRNSRRMRKKRPRRYR